MSSCQIQNADGGIEIPHTTVLYTVGASWAPQLVEVGILAQIPTQVVEYRGGRLVLGLVGTVRKVRVIEVRKGPSKTIFRLCYGRIADLPWDPSKLRWKGDVNTLFMAYCTKMGRVLLKKRHHIPKIIERKWAGVLPSSFKLRWTNVWSKARAQKESGLLWSVWHIVVAVNEWRGRI